MQQQINNLRSNNNGNISEEIIKILNENGLTDNEIREELNEIREELNEFKEEFKEEIKEVKKDAEEMKGDISHLKRQDYETIIHNKEMREFWGKYYNSILLLKIINKIATDNVESRYFIIQLEEFIKLYNLKINFDNQMKQDFLTFIDFKLNGKINVNGKY